MKNGEDEGWYSSFINKNVIGLFIKDHGRTESDEILNNKSEVCHVEGTINVDDGEEWLNAQHKVKNSSSWYKLEGIYRRETMLMERDISIKAAQLAFVIGFLLGGLHKRHIAQERFAMHSIGRRYLSPVDCTVRRIDYYTLMFIKHGIFTGLRLSLLFGSIIGITTHITLLRDRYSFWQFPVISGALTSLFALQFGVLKFAQALGLGISSGILCNTCLYIFAMANGQTLNEAYFSVKHRYEENMQEIWRLQREMRSSKKFEESRIEFQEKIHLKVESLKKWIKNDER